MNFPLRVTLVGVALLLAVIDKTSATEPRSLPTEPLHIPNEPLRISTEPLRIRVRVQKLLGPIRLSARQLAVGLSPEQVMPIKMTRGSDLELTRSRSKRFGLWRFRAKGERRWQTLMGDQLVVEGVGLKINSKSVPHTVQLMASKSGDVDVVASLDLEKYLTGVLPSEMPAGWPVEALKAQVIASRSYAVALMLERRNQTYDIESSVLDQVFDLENHRQISEVKQSKVNQVIRATAGWILTDPKGQVLKAFYHADCGGQTETARQVWGDRVFEGGVTRDESCPLSPWGRWEYGASLGELSAKLSPLLGTTAESPVADVKILERTSSGRVGHVEVAFLNGMKMQILAHDFRRLMGYSNLKSTNFSFHWQDGYLMVQGQGNGHGVGLCQFGTRRLAEMGKNYREILNHYYSQARLKLLPGRNIFVARSSKAVALGN